MLAASLTLGLFVAIAAVFRIRVLERRSEQQHARTGTSRAGNAAALESAGTARRKRNARASRASCTTKWDRCSPPCEWKSGGRSAPKRSAARVRIDMAETKGLIDRMMRFVRDLAMGLRPSMLDDSVFSLPSRGRPATSRAATTCRSIFASRAIWSDCPTSTATCIYRVVQEALTNCAKHSAATEIEISVKGSGGHPECLRQRQRRRHQLESVKRGTWADGNQGAHQGNEWNGVD
jgi:hypothetical protein